MTDKKLLRLHEVLELPPETKVRRVDEPIAKMIQMKREALAKAGQS